VSAPQRPRLGENGRKIIDAASQWLVVNLSDREISAAIIESCRAGDRDAFRVLYDLYKDRVYSISLYFFHGDQALACDVTQQVFLKLMTSGQRTVHVLGEPLIQILAAWTGIS